MSAEPREKKILTLSEAHQILEKIDVEKADQIQKRTLDYTSKFAKITVESAKKVGFIQIRNSARNERYVQYIQRYEEIITHPCFRRAKESGLQALDRSLPRFGEGLLDALARGHERVDVLFVRDWDLYEGG